MTQILHLHFLGGYRLTYGDVPVTTVHSDRLQSLLAYVVLHRHAPQARRQIAALIWPDSPEAQARSNLRNLLFQLRQALPDPDLFLAADATTLQWRRDAPFVLDVAQFEQELEAAATAQAAGDRSQAQRALESAAGLYTGNLLPGNYDDWILPWREQLRTRYLDALVTWSRLLEESGDLQAAVRAVQRLLQQDPLNESTYVRLMELHARLGDRAGLQRVYTACVAALERELEVEPSPVTQAAYTQALAAVAQVSGPAHTPLPAATPAQPAPPRRPRLPVAATPFVGRETELAELAERLARADVRLITLVGPGGIGKTRLALQTAMGHQTVFADGVAFVALAGVTAPHLIVPTIADALGIPITGNTGPDSQLFAALAGRELLLVLDNVEQLLAGIDVVAALLEQAPGVKLLVTSRERLNLQEEWVFDLHGLPVPPPRGEALEENASAALFLLHARRTRSDFVLAPADDLALRRICRLVEGMPLALELAASWVRLLSCQEIADEIAASLDFLSAARRNAPDRHRSIRAVFAHSWALLSPAEQQTLARLSVLRGGFDREAAEQVAEAGLPVLSALVDKSLVRRAPSHRYEPHELIRQFAWEKLQASGELAQIQYLHLVHFLTLAESVEPQLNERDQVKWLRRLDLEADNLQAAFDAVWALADYGRGMRLAAALWRYWLIHGALADGRRQVERLLAYRDQVASPILVRFLYAAGSIAFYQQELGPAAAYFEECVALERAHHNRQGLALALNRLAMVVQENQEFDRAESLYHEALALARTLGDETGVTRGLINLGTLAYDRGDVTAATPFFVEALALARRRGDQDSIATALVNLCWSSVLAGRPDALESGLEALAQFREMHNVYGLAYALEGVAGAYTTYDAGLAALLFGVAGALRRTIQAPLSPLNQGYIDRMMAPAQQTLGPADFDRLCAEGATRPLDEMLDLALTLTSRPA